MKVIEFKSIFEVENVVFFFELGLYVKCVELSYVYDARSKTKFYSTSLNGHVFFYKQVLSNKDCLSRRVFWLALGNNSVNQGCFEF